MLVLVLAGMGLVAAAAVLGVVAISDWRLKAVAAAGGAIAMFAASGLLPVWLGAAVGRRDKDKVALERSIYMPGRKVPLVRDITNPVSMGVRAPARAGVGDRMPPYVPRDIDAALRQALGGSGFVLLVGAAATGKTRTGYEAIRAALPGHIFIAPKGTDDVTEAMAAARAERDCVLWLDSLQRYLGAGAITSRSIAELLDGSRHHRVALATLRAAEESRLIRMAGSLPGGQLMREGQAVLDLVDHRIVIDRVFSDGELARATVLAATDSRLADALRHASRYGIPEYLSSGPQLHTEWDNAWEHGTHPRGAALIAAAVDCRLAGFAAPLPRALLDQLQQDYLDRRGQTRARPETLAEAWAWATEFRDSGNAPLRLAGQETYDVFDYIVDLRARGPALVPEPTVHAALRFAGSADAVVIGGTAWYQDRPELAVAGFRRAYRELVRTGRPDERATLASRSDLAVTLHALGRLPDAETEYRTILDRRTAAFGEADPDTLASRNNLATLMHAQRRLTEAEAEYRAVLDIRTRTLGDAHPSTLLTRNNLGVVLIDLNRLDEAEAELEEVVELRSRVLGPDHPHTVISRRNRDTARRKRSGG